MSSDLSFEGKVAVVTGAGGGLGRSHALALAARGAKVVVNDLGGTFTGEGASAAAADTVCAEIKEAGGEATPNYDSVTDGEKIIQTAIDTYGRIDILINNAGILRDVSFQKMTQDDWDKIYEVHVLGGFKTTYAAWPHMREQNFGRVIMTASAAGIYGNFGQANYAMAKLGLVGLSNTLAIEGQRRGIHVNTIAPIAGSRMTETVLPPALIDALRPEYVTPLVEWLCHEDCEENGGLFEIGGGFMGKLRWERAQGKTFRLGRSFSAEDVKGQWDAIAGFDKTTHPDTIHSSMQPIMENVEAGPSMGGNQYIDLDAALGYTFPDFENSYDERDTALYALGVGAAQDPSDSDGLQLVYEMHGSGMRVLPTYGVIPALNAIMTMARDGTTAPGMNFGLDRLLHGEQYTELVRPLPPKAKLTHVAKVKDIFDKGKHALVVNEVTTYDQDGNVLVRNEITSLIRGAGGWGGDRGPSSDINVPPDRAPDKVIEETIPENQALLYRLSGDWNPLHADPGFAKAFGFERPILHGLCTFGYASRHVVDSFAPDGDLRFFKSIRTRFADSVFPGETLITEMWKESDGKVIFRAKVKERDTVVISHAAVEFYSEIPKPKAKAKAKQAGAAASAPRVPISADIFNAIHAFVSSSPEIAEKAKTIFQFKLSNPESVWTINLKDSASALQGEPVPPQCTLEMSDADFMAMSTGKADAMKLFSTGKLKISGDVMASQKLGFLKKLTPEMVMAEMDKRLGAGGGEAAAATEGGGEPVPTSWDVFIAIRDHIERNAEMVSKVGYSFLFKLKEPESAWVVDLKNGAGAVSEGEGTADCTLEITESDFIDMTTGKANAMKLFTTGKLKISGNVMASQKLEFLAQMDPEQAKAAVLKARAAGQGPGKVAAAPAAKAEPNAPVIFEALAARLGERPELAGEIKAVLRFSVSEPDAVWTVDMSGGTPSVASGDDGDAATTFGISDADLAALVKGEVSMRNLFQHGKIRVDGDVTVAHRLGFLKGLIS